MRIIDISMNLEQGMITYPGNEPYSIEQVKSIPADSSNLSVIKLGVHTGTHADAPLHINNNGLSINELSLENFYGNSIVIDCTMTPFGQGISVDELKGRDYKKGDIVLLKTRNSTTGFKEFKEKFVYLTEEGADYLVSKGVKLVGIDYLSIQKFHAGYCASHCSLLNKGVIIIEGLDLSKVKEGRYEFIGFPLKLIGAEGSPLRAVLLERLP